MSSAIKLRECLEGAFMKYVKAFEKKQGIIFSGWDSEDINFRLCHFEHEGKPIAFSMDDVLTDIDKECRRGLIFDWHNYTGGGVIELYLSYEYYIENETNKK